MKNTLIIFIRNPVLGKVKTRLAAALGEKEALRIYRILLEKTRQTALQTAARRLLFYADFIPKNDAWPSKYFDKRLQVAGDLGARMQQAFEAAFADGAEKVLIIGSDCPMLDSQRLLRAFAALDEADFVLGPASDGGYYLLGMTMPAPCLFEGIAWSTGEVRAQTLQKMAARNKRCFLLPELDDIDEAADWRRYEQRKQ